MCTHMETHTHTHTQTNICKMYGSMHILVRIRLYLLLNTAILVAACEDSVCIHGAEFNI